MNVSNLPGVPAAILVVNMSLYMKRMWLMWSSLINVLIKCAGSFFCNGNIDFDSVKSIYSTVNSVCDCLLLWPWGARLAVHIFHHGWEKALNVWSFPVVDKSNESCSHNGPAWVIAYLWRTVDVSETWAEVFPDNQSGRVAWETTMAKRKAVSSSWLSSSLVTTSTPPNVVECYLWTITILTI